MTRLDPALAAGLLTILARGNGRTIEVPDILGQPGGHWGSSHALDRAEARMAPYRAAGLVVRHCIPARVPEVWYSLTTLGVAITQDAQNSLVLGKPSDSGVVLHQRGGAHR